MHQRMVPRRNARPMPTNTLRRCKKQILRRMARRLGPFERKSSTPTGGVIIKTLKSNYYKQGITNFLRPSHPHRICNRHSSTPIGGVFPHSQVQLPQAVRPQHPRAPAQELHRHRHPRRIHHASPSSAPRCSPTAPSECSTAVTRADAANSTTST